MGTVTEMDFMERGVVLAPIHLLPLLEIYCSSMTANCPHVKERQGSFRPIQELKQMGLVDGPDVCHVDSHGLEVTDKGRAYIEALLRIPLPVQSWVVPGSV